MLESRRRPAGKCQQIDRIRCSTKRSRMNRKTRISESVRAQQASNIKFRSGTRELRSQARTCGNRDFVESGGPCDKSVTRGEIQLDIPARVLFEFNYPYLFYFPNETLCHGTLKEGPSKILRPVTIRCERLSSCSFQLFSVIFISSHDYSFELLVKKISVARLKKKKKHQD